MKRHTWHAIQMALLAGGLSLSHQTAQAAYACTLNVTPIGMLYSPTFATEAVMTGSFSFSCTRALTDPATLAWDLAADNGIHAAGANSRVQLGATTSRYIYNLYKTAPYTNANRWQTANANNRFSGSLAFGTSLSASWPATTFFTRMTALQAAQTAGVYTDTVTATLRIDTTATVLNTAQFDVTVTTQNECQFSTVPTPINLSYTALQTTVATGTSNFQARCTPGMPYSLALDASSATLLGLYYSLALNATTSSGTGLPQPFSVTATLPANQAGTCATGSCNGSQARSVIITY
jgi:spore coat protein U-like protein